MPRRDHFVIHKLALRTQVTLQTFLRAVNHIPRVHHSQRNRFLVCPLSLRMRPEPRRRRAVAIFAGNSVRYFKRPPALSDGRIECVARQTFRRIFRFGAQLQDTRHALTNVPGQRLVRLAVLILNNPRGVFVLQDAAIGHRLHAAMATGRRARARADVLG